ncbi:DUF378 domain-containing protein [Clostridium polynesiense]|uniref:DUF378 domain-containing protein n=1 Tax=Clostridium polynesiense TaxID=1325933 RepID=UPI0005903D9C|nr:DUF378 domain-containing protein [Clostridium polynesiense]
MYKLNLFDKISFVLVLLGALNWGLIGLTNLDLVGLIFGNIPILQRIVYIFIGAAAINLILLLFRSKCINMKFKK